MRTARSSPSNIWSSEGLIPRPPQSRETKLWSPSETVPSESGNLPSSVFPAQRSCGCPQVPFLSLRSGFPWSSPYCGSAPPSRQAIHRRWNTACRSSHNTSPEWSSRPCPLPHRSSEFPGHGQEYPLSYKTPLIYCFRRSHHDPESSAWLITSGLSEWSSRFISRIS